MLQPASKSSSARSYVPHPVLRIRRPRVLVVEDDVDLGTVVRRTIRSLDPDLAVDWCTSAEEARHYLKQHEYDVVLTDFMLEGRQSGLTLRDAVRRHQPHASFAVMSSLPVGDFLRAVRGAPCPFLAKPFAVAELRSFLDGLLADLPSGEPESD